MYKKGSDAMSLKYWKKKTAANLKFYTSEISFTSGGKIETFFLTQ